MSQDGCYSALRRLLSDLEAEDGMDTVARFSYAHKAIEKTDEKAIEVRIVSDHLVYINGEVITDRIVSCVQAKVVAALADILEVPHAYEMLGDVMSFRFAGRRYDLQYRCPMKVFIRNATSLLRGVREEIGTRDVMYV